MIIQELTKIHFENINLEDVNIEDVELSKISLGENVKIPLLLKFQISIINSLDPINESLNYLDRVFQNQYHKILKIEKDNPKSKFS